MTDYLIALKQLHQTKIEPYRGLPVGSAEHDIAELEAILGYRLPLAYRQFLQWMGADYAGIFQGSDCFLRNVQHNTAYLPILLAENAIPAPPPMTYLVFFLHQGYSAGWFEVPTSMENPQTWWYREGQQLTTPEQRGTLIEELYADMAGLATILPTITSSGSRR